MTMPDQTIDGLRLYIFTTVLEGFQNWGIILGIVGSTFVFKKV